MTRGMSELIRSLQVGVGAAFKCYSLPVELADESREVSDHTHVQCHEAAHQTEGDQSDLRGRWCEYGFSMKA